jgi:hypothetical protein
MKATRTATGVARLRLGPTGRTAAGAAPGDGAAGADARLRRHPSRPTWGGTRSPTADAGPQVAAHASVAVRFGNAVPVAPDELAHLPAPPDWVGEAVGAAPAGPTITARRRPGPTITAGRRPAVTVANTPALQQMKAEFTLGPGVRLRAAAATDGSVYGLRTADGGG